MFNYALQRGLHRIDYHNYCGLYALINFNFFDDFVNGVSLSCFLLSHLTFPIPPRKKMVKLSGLTLKNIFGNKMLHVTQCYSQV